MILDLDHLMFTLKEKEAQRIALPIQDKWGSQECCGQAEKREGVVASGGVKGKERNRGRHALEGAWELDMALLGRCCLFRPIDTTASLYTYRGLHQASRGTNPDR